MQEIEKIKPKPEGKISSFNSLLQYEKNHRRIGRANSSNKEENSLKDKQQTESNLRGQASKITLTIKGSTEAVTAVKRWKE
ncbi:hypothetical protein EB796_000714 [Bugula neritina]|uniref:Uncharacterized protein n=1 Tax=Bugula neritina TaxID=10212 RepID=A0A7J7KS77_BUGNE|nr:hypothetical protein EB796_000714 [Bugula neritina]